MGFSFVLFALDLVMDLICLFFNSLSLSLFLFISLSVFFSLVFQPIYSHFVFTDSERVGKSHCLYLPLYTLFITEEDTGRQTDRHRCNTVMCTQIITTPYFCYIYIYILFMYIETCVEGCGVCCAIRFLRAHHNSNAGNSRGMF